MLAPDAACDLVNQGSRNTELSANFGKRLPFCSKDKQACDVRIFQFGGRVHLSLPDPSPGSILKARVVRAGNPSEVMGGVVEAVAVNMVHRSIGKVARHERRRDQPMNIEPMLLAAAFQHDLLVAVRDAGSQDAALPQLSRLQSTSGRGEIVQRPQVAGACGFQNPFKAGDGRPISHGHTLRGDTGNSNNESDLYDD